MAASHDGDEIRVGDIKMVPARTEGASNVFSPTPFILTRTRWIPDSEASFCVLCTEKFTQVRRKHHCRVCGRVLCAKCCFEKILMPQYGEEEAERVCNYCFPVSNMISMARSTQMAPRLSAAKGLAELCTQQNELKKLVESGGIQALIHLAQTNIQDVKEAVIDGLNTLAMHPSLHPMLIQCGGIKALCSILSSSSNDGSSQVIIKALSTLKLLSKSEKMKIVVVTEGGLTPLMALSMSTDKTITIVALTTLSVLLESSTNVTSFTENFKNGLQTIFKLTRSDDEKIQEVALRVLALISFCSSQLRKKLIEEDNYSGKCILNAVKQKPKNLEVYTNTSCLIANLAVCEECQSSLMDCIDLVCRLVGSHPQNNNIQTHTSRAIANFAKHKENGRFLIAHLPDILRVHVNSPNQEIKAHGIRTVFYLLEYQKDKTIATLTSEGIDGLLDGILHFNGVVGSIRQTLVRHVPEMSKPM